MALSGLRKAYGPVQAVAGIDLTIGRGEVVALLGPNGAGKSTTIDVMLGLASPDAGTVLVLGKSPSEAARSGRVGAMLQNGGLLPDVTVAELIGLLRKVYASHRTVGDVLEAAGVADLAKRRTTALSGGQRQRVRVAMALVPDPDLLVLDEPTVAMDVAGRRAFWAQITELARSGRTVLFATHYLAEAESYADRVVVMRAGRVVADGTAAQISAGAGGRTVRARIPHPARDLLAALPGVRAVDISAEQPGLTPVVALHCSDSDAALRALLAAHADASDIEVRGDGLEEAFIALTDDHAAAADDGARQATTAHSTTARSTTANTTTAEV